MRYVLMGFATVFAVACNFETNYYEKDDDIMAVGITEHKTGWSSAGVLTTGDKLKAVQLQADFPEPYSYCIEFSKSNAIPTNPPKATNLPIRSEAIITWTVEGNFVQRRISIANGTTIQGVAQAVKVQVVDATVDSQRNAAAPTKANAVDYNVSVQVTRGTRGSTSHPPVLLPRTTDDNLAYYNIFLIPGVLESISIPIPQNAGAVSVNVNGIPLGAAGAPKAVVAGAITVNMLQGANVLASYNYTDQSPSQFVALVPGTDTIGVNINPGTDAALTEYVFTLMLGVDG